MGKFVLSKSKVAIASIYFDEETQQFCAWVGEAAYLEFSGEDVSQDPDGLARYRAYLEERTKDDQYPMLKRRLKAVKHMEKARNSKCEYIINRIRHLDMSNDGSFRLEFFDDMNEEPLLKTGNIVHENGFAEILDIGNPKVLEKCHHLRIIKRPSLSFRKHRHGPFHFSRAIEDTEMSVDQKLNLDIVSDTLHVEIQGEKSQIRSLALKAPAEATRGDDVRKALGTHGYTMLSPVYRTEPPQFYDECLFNGHENVRDLIWDYVGATFELVLPFIDVPMILQQFFRKDFAQIIVEFLGIQNEQVFLIQLNSEFYDFQSNSEDSFLDIIPTHKISSNKIGAFIHSFSLFTLVRSPTSISSVYYDEECRSLKSVVCDSRFLQYNGSVVSNDSEMLKMYKEDLKSQGAENEKQGSIKYKKLHAIEHIEKGRHEKMGCVTSLPMGASTGTFFAFDFLNEKNESIQKTRKYLYENGFVEPGNLAHSPNCFKFRRFRIIQYVGKEKGLFGRFKNETTFGPYSLRNEASSSDIKDLWDIGEKETELVREAEPDAAIKEEKAELVEAKEEIVKAKDVEPEVFNGKKTSKAKRAIHESKTSSETMDAKLRAQEEASKMQEIDQKLLDVRIVSDTSHVEIEGPKSRIQSPVLKAPAQEIKRDGLRKALGAHGYAMVSPLYHIEPPQFYDECVFNPHGNIRALIWDYSGATFELVLPFIDVPMILQTIFPKNIALIIVEFLGMQNERLFLIHGNSIVSEDSFLEIIPTHTNDTISSNEIRAFIHHFSLFILVRSKTAICSVYYDEECRSLKALVCQSGFLRYNGNVVSNDSEMLEMYKKDLESKEAENAEQKAIKYRKLRAVKLIEKGRHEKIGCVTSLFPMNMLDDEPTGSIQNTFAFDFLDENNESIQKTGKYYYENGFAETGDLAHAPNYFKFRRFSIIQYFNEDNSWLSYFYNPKTETPFGPYSLRNETSRSDIDESTNFVIPATAIIEDTDKACWKTPWLRFDCLQSDPLIMQESEMDVSCFRAVEDDVIVPPALDFSVENDIIAEVINQSNANFEWDISLLTRESLFRLSSHILHLSGHGEAGNLIIEDGYGGTLFYGKERLEKMNLLESNPNLRIVFVSMCDSESIAKTFADMGVRHVIAVQNTDKVKLRTAEEFTDMFYTHLFKKKLTLAAAFKSAVDYIEKQGKKCPMKLLPTDGDHDLTLVQIFSDLIESVYSEPRHVKRSRNNPQVLISAIPNRDFTKYIHHFTIWRALDSLARSRLLAIYGPPYVGREEVAAFTAHYTHRLMHYQDAILVVSFTQQIQTQQEFFDRMATTINAVCEVEVKANFYSILNFILEKRMAFFFTMDTIGKGDFLPDDMELKNAIINIIARLQNSTKAAAFCICITTENYEIAKEQSLFFRNHEGVKCEFMNEDSAMDCLLRQLNNEAQAELMNSKLFSKSSRLPLSSVVIEGLRNLFQRDRVSKYTLEYILKCDRNEWESKLKSSTCDTDVLRRISDWYDVVEMLRPAWDLHIIQKEAQANIRRMGDSCRDDIKEEEDDDDKDPRDDEDIEEDSRGRYSESDHDTREESVDDMQDGIDAMQWQWLMEFLKQNNPTILTSDIEGVVKKYQEAFPNENIEMFYSFLKENEEDIEDRWLRSEVGRNKLLKVLNDKIRADPERNSITNRRTREDVGCEFEELYGISAERATDYILNPCPAMAAGLDQIKKEKWSTQV